MTRAAGHVECPDCASVFLATDHRYVRIGECVRCGTEYETQSPRRRYCSRDCQLADRLQAQREARASGELTWCNACERYTEDPAHRCKPRPGTDPT